MSSLPSADMAAFKELLSSSKHIIAVAGAGLSAASGESPRVVLGRAPGAPFFLGFRYPNVQRIWGYVAQI